MKRPTITDIARRAGVSKVAVSYALNGQPGVSETTRNMIMTIAEEIGWRPNSAARALNGAHAHSIGLVLRRPARILGVEPFFMELISGIQDELSARSYALMLQMVESHSEEIELYRRWWGERRIDGAILVDLHVADPRVAVVESLRMPAVVVGHPSESGSLTSVWSDDSATVRETVRYLAALGHRRIARVAGLPKLVHTVLRDLAFIEICTELGLDGHPVEHTDYTGEQGARATRRMLASPDRPSAIVYDNDIMAVAGMSVAQELRLAVPADLSIVGWDDSPLSQVVRPALTAVTRDIPAYGARAARTLMSLIAGERVHDVEDAAAQLTPRGSTGAPAAPLPGEAGTPAGVV
ncbi:LacI family DNA-binding transcriptional regulator [Planomonospora sp. ID67723]|uniref:LacI family DNA-binding transcriptional regulator n=1 Tax=Planomonospora sp. ID67723 TaxID=2738134 RepID=UPI0018C40784|nr:LacI family DNA-binding transcriptional regulator [Planomonospora sp. ID67723]MBG0827139.1 LacI family DNA-binding transcriptional regulator [Planomonospora sp. ID67723]